MAYICRQRLCAEVESKAPLVAIDIRLGIGCASDDTKDDLTAKTKR
jgi:hypothetical protein